MCFGYDGDSALNESLERRGLSRRSLFGGALGLLGAAAVAGGVSAPAYAGPQGKRPVPGGLISIQLYTLRSIMRGAGVDTTLETLAQIGYPRVELAGLYGRTPASMRAKLDSLGIKASSSHDGISANEAAARTKFENALVLGQKYINVPYLASNNLADWQRWADQMNAEAAIAKSYGLRYGYHNHAHEFTTDLGGGVTPWQVFMSRLDPKLVHLEVDLYWAVTAGVNLGKSNADSIQFAIDVIKAAPLETRQYHVKDRNPANGDHADLGTGFIDFARIFDAHRVEEFIVENDTPDVTPIQTAQVGYSYLRNLRF